MRNNLVIYILIGLLMINYTFAGDMSFWGKKKGGLKAFSDTLRILHKGKKIELTGNVKMIKDDMTIYANKAKVYDKKEKLEAFGSVLITKMYENGNYIKATGDTFSFNNKKQYGLLKKTKKVKSFRKDDKLLITLKCRDLEFNSHKKIIEAKHNVVALKEDKTLKIVSGYALYNEEKSYILFTKKPICYQFDERGEGVYKADKIYYFTKTDKVILEKKASVDFLPKEDKKE